jgi:TrmH family RNA methyltransferase
MLKISSVQNPKVKEVLALRERKHRDQTGLFLIEGKRELERARGAKVKIEEVFYCPEYGTRTEGIECTPEVFDKMSYRENPDGILGVARQFHHELASLKLSKKPFLVIAEQIEKPGNLGTILRSCDAAGVDALILADPTTDLFNPNVVRSSMGALFTVPIFETTSQEAIAFCKQHRIAIVATTPHVKQLYTQADFTQPLAVAVGGEAEGLTQEWIQQAEIPVKIPMHGMADSLNVASATTLVLYEVVRQRSS